MTNLLNYPTIQNTGGDGAGAPGAAPNGASMQGNPQSSQFTPFGNYPPNAQSPRDGAVGDNTKTATQQIAQGAVPLNIQPTNVGGGASGVPNPGGDSLLAMLSRGQVVLNSSSYGQGGNLPLAGGIPPVGISAAAPIISGVNGTNAPNQNYIGN